MKTLSLKLDDAVFEETEEVIAQLKQARNRYINEAVHLYNKYNKRKELKSRLAAETKLVAASSYEVLREFENLIDDL
jgi:metal-responsive CopG/Arc/MetJ family transcriptional regulator